MSNKLKIYCVTNKVLKNLENSSLKLVGVGKEKFSEKYLDCSEKINIYSKEKYYSELTFHYWYWKNLLQNEDAEWVGFCQKRRFWIKKNTDIEKVNSENLLENLLFEPENDWKNYNTLLCNPINISGTTKMKLIKRGWRNIIKNPSLIFSKKKESIKLHFDMHHGYGNLDKAIEMLNDDDKLDFKKFVENNNEFNPHIMFIAKPKIIKLWFSALFPWLEKCEKIFGFENLQGYDTTRMYAYLAERYQSFWFKKYTIYKEIPWIFIDQ